MKWDANLKKRRVISYWSRKSSGDLLPDLIDELEKFLRGVDVCQDNYIVVWGWAADDYGSGIEEPLKQWLSIPDASDIPASDLIVIGYEKAAAADDPFFGNGVELCFAQQNDMNDFPGDQWQNQK